MSLCVRCRRRRRWKQDLCRNCMRAATRLVPRLAKW